MLLSENPNGGRWPPARLALPYSCTGKGKPTIGTRSYRRFAPSFEGWTGKIGPREAIDTFLR